jgi:exopolysaccharide biosynthesis protein
VRRSSAALLAFAFASVAHAEWTVVSTQSEFSAGPRVEHRHIVARSDTGEQATLECAIFSTKTATLRVIDDPSANSDLATIMQRENCIAGTNGGYFDPDYAPVGLLVSGGQTITPLGKAKLLSGVVSVANGRVQIQRAAEFSTKTKPTAARQCGPFLVDRGRAIVGLNNTRSARRTFVAASGERVAIGYCSALTLGQLADLLASTVIANFKIERAFNLDGGSSSAFWFAGEKGVFSLREQKTVRDYMAIVAK